MRGPLSLDDDELSSCVSCGLCLPHCPTFRVTGEEVASPRGRIALMRRVEREGAPVDAAFVAAMDACVQCRGCETACPSAVPFGRLMEATRASLAPRRGPWLRMALRALSWPRLVRAGSSAAALAQRAHLVPARFGLPAHLVVRRQPLRPTGTDGWLFTGCVMDAWQRPVHAAVLEVARAAGRGLRLPEPVRGAGCCGALSVHAGFVDDARVAAQAVLRSMPGDGPVVVDSAGCGAALKDYGHLLGTEEGARFAARVLDVHEWLASFLGDLPPARRPAAGGLPVALQDPCHLRHVQRSHAAVRTVLAPYVSALVELDDEGLCCGAGGAYSLLQPELSGDIRRRKLDALARSGAAVVASANPGCAVHLANAGVRVHHPVELIAEAVRHG